MDYRIHILILLVSQINEKSFELTAGCTLILFFGLLIFSAIAGSDSDVAKVKSDSIPSMKELKLPPSIRKHLDKVIQAKKDKGKT